MHSLPPILTCSEQPEPLPPPRLTPATTYQDLWKAPLSYYLSGFLLLFLPVEISDGLICTTGKAWSPPRTQQHCLFSAYEENLGGPCHAFREVIISDTYTFMHTSRPLFPGLQGFQSRHASCSLTGLVALCVHENSWNSCLISPCPSLPKTCFHSHTVCHFPVVCFRCPPLPAALRVCSFLHTQDISWNLDFRGH